MDRAMPKWQFKGDSLTGLVDGTVGNEEGLDLLARDDRERNPTHLAVPRGRPWLEQRLLQRGAPDTRRRAP